MEKLYEDLKEQGKLMKFLCKVGDTVYVLDEDTYYYSIMQVNKIEIKPTIYGDVCYFLEPASKRGRLYRYYEDDFKKHVFLNSPPDHLISM